ncbi:DNA polymerase III subunit beta [Ferviditalea candida]|uniref:Beta sliding clamp n=1 Tax=Ferviditalea candida TaxID=3108399 RepID=A0ABU5ZL51_9BACL|nr:DNA polymerase III subunit beta [Paenibacillaceae bacterium T2]
MKLNILKDELNEAIQHVSKAISYKTTIPILSGIKIDAASNGITLTASDTDITIQSFIPLEKQDKTIIQMHKTGSVVLPAKFFVEIIKKLPSHYIEIEVSENYQTTIRSGSAEIQLVGMDPEEYPMMPRLEENQVISISGVVLKTMIKQTGFAVSNNESTPVLTGVLCNLKQKKLKFVATDRHRLATSTIEVDTDAELELDNIVISGKTLNELSKIIPDQDSVVHIVAADSQVLFKMESVLFYSRILDGTYPDTSKIISQNYQTELVVKTKLLTDAIDRAYLLSREEKTNIVKLAGEGERSIEISSSSSELGKVKEEIEVVKLTGEPVKISFNSKYMLDALKVIDSEQIVIGFTGVMSPIIIKPDQDVDMIHLILPYRTVN